MSAQSIYQAWKSGVLNQVIGDDFWNVLITNEDIKNIVKE